MDLEELLSVMDRAAANLAKLEAVWARASVFIPDSPRGDLTLNTMIIAEPGPTFSRAFRRLMVG